MTALRLMQLRQPTHSQRVQRRDGVAHIAAFNAADRVVVATKPCGDINLRQPHGFAQRAEFSGGHGSISPIVAGVPKLVIRPVWIQLIPSCRADGFTQPFVSFRPKNGDFMGGVTRVAIAVSYGNAREIFTKNIAVKPDAPRILKRHDHSQAFFAGNLRRTDDAALEVNHLFAANSGVRFGSSPRVGVIFPIPSETAHYSTYRILGVPVCRFGSDTERHADNMIIGHLFVSGCVGGLANPNGAQIAQLPRHGSRVRDVCRFDVIGFKISKIRPGAVKPISRRPAVAPPIIVLAQIATLPKCSCIVPAVDRRNGGQSQTIIHDQVNISAVDRDKPNHNGGRVIGNSARRCEINPLPMRVAAAQPLRAADDFNFSPRQAAGFEVSLIEYGIPGAADFCGGDSDGHFSVPGLGFHGSGRNIVDAAAHRVYGQVGAHSSQQRCGVRNVAKLTSAEAAKPLVHLLDQRGALCVLPVEKGNGVHRASAVFVFAGQRGGFRGGNDGFGSNIARRCVQGGAPDFPVSTANFGGVNVGDNGGGHGGCGDQVFHLNLSSMGLTALMNTDYSEIIGMASGNSEKARKKQSQIVTAKGAKH